jgi:phosphonate C-P lyase system protein PhnG
MDKVDYILCECNLQALEQLVTALEDGLQITIARMPSICMTMIEAEDSVDYQPFYLGEALTTECELMVNGQKGYGICLGDEPLRCYCIAFVDAYRHLSNANINLLQQFLNKQLQEIELAEKTEYQHIQRTKVDFKLMEQD